MTIILSSQSRSTDSSASAIVGQLGDSLGIPGFAEMGNTYKPTADILAVKDKLTGVLNKLLGKTNNDFDPSYVESGKQVIVGSGISGTNTPALEQANVRQIYSQTPQASVIIKKRAFSSLRDYYDPVFLDPAERWLMRATKRLVARKCEIMADYERLTKIEKLQGSGADIGSLMMSLISSASAEEGGDDFDADYEFEQIIGLRQPVRTTTYFTDTENSILEELGVGSGVFEITAVTRLNTSLGIDGNGQCSFSIEDPYRILFVTEEDIEAAIRETVLSNFANQYNNSAGAALNNAQSNDGLLSKERTQNGKSDISFSIGVGGGVGITAIIDAIGFSISPNNLDDVPPGQELSSQEQTLFNLVWADLSIYDQVMKKSLLGGANLSNMTELAPQMKFVRDKMRMYYLGKSIIQPMDTVNIFIDGGTRKQGEGESVDDLFEVKTPVDVAKNALGIGMQGSQEIDEALLQFEHEQYWARGGKMTFDDFKKIRTITYSTENSTHVFGGLIKNVSDAFDASSGAHTINVSGDSNMEWLKISRFNQQPSLNQTQGIVYDPLSPFEIDIDEGTGLPTGAPKLSAANKSLINRVTDNGRHCRLYFDSGPKTGKEMSTIEDMAQDIQEIGPNTLTKYQHAPGLVYQWKEGIMTATYNMFNSNPLDNSKINAQQLRRDVGFFASNTPFDNLDAANIISVMVTGFPYNVATFIQNAASTGAYVPDTALNRGRDYFHSFLNVQRSFIKAHGGFSPFKSINIDPLQLAENINLQRKLTDKSSKLSQLKRREAVLIDKKLNLPEDTKDIGIKESINKKIREVEEQITVLETNLSSLAKSGKELETNIVQIAGNDISFDLANITNDDEFRLFGDRLAHAVLKRREDVIRNIDKNYLIISDEYDKDYDIQSFVLKLREQSPDLWKSTWLDVYGLCRKVAEILNFELFCDTQGNIVFRPPQYNRMPASVLNEMLNLSRAGGVTLFPPFLTKLFQTRENYLVKEVAIQEWKIRQQAALLGKDNDKDVARLVEGNENTSFIFISEDRGSVKESSKVITALEPNEKESLKINVKNANAAVQLKKTSGLFSAIAQKNLHRSSLLSRSQSKSFGKKEYYDKATRTLSALTGQQYRSFAEFDKIKVGATKNGQSTPSTDIANIINNIASLVSQRSKTLRSLERVIDQNIEIGSLGEDGTLKLSPKSFGGVNLPPRLSNQLVEDDTKDMLGHLSGERFIIKDENIYSSTFNERPPEMTSVTVNGTAPIVGGQGDLAGVPVFTAFGVDFDMWRQYGWRPEKTFDKPFFSSAELQCAPYAVMLLSRQRRNIVTGNVQVMGNEFYQLGDAVFVANRQLLYYVEKIQHSFSYEGDFKTTLDLKYGHPPGQYIPTPLDIMGKMQTTTGNFQSAYRIRREKGRGDDLLGVVVFDENSDKLFEGKHKFRNFAELKRASLDAHKEINKIDKISSPRVYCMWFFGEEDLQESRVKKVLDWFKDPTRPSSKGDGAGGITTTESSQMGPDSILKYKIDADLVHNQYLRQCLPDESQYDKVENELLSQGIVASAESRVLDPSLGNCIEIQLRFPPAGGWPKDD